MQKQAFSMQENPPVVAWDMAKSGELLIRLAKETTLPGLINLILSEAQQLTGAEGGTFYRWRR